VFGAVADFAFQVNCAQSGRQLRQLLYIHVLLLMQGVVQPVKLSAADKAAVLMLASLLLRLLLALLLLLLLLLLLWLSHLLVFGGSSSALGFCWLAPHTSQTCRLATPTYGCHSLL
jgi:hypothetical protein